jgi:hypothetical protein
MMVDFKNAQGNLDKCNTLISIDTFIRNANRLIKNGKDTPAVRANLAAAEEKYWTLSASAHNAGVEVDKALWTALKDYEALRSELNGRRFRSSYLRRKIASTDIVTSVSDAVLKGSKTIGLKSLTELDRIDGSFEEVVIKFAKSFDLKVVEAAKATLRHIKSCKNE